MTKLILAALWLSFTGHALFTSDDHTQPLTRTDAISCFQDTIPKRSHTPAKQTKKSGKKQTKKDTTTSPSQDTTRRY